MNSNIELSLLEADEKQLLEYIWNLIPEQDRQGMSQSDVLLVLDLMDDFLMEKHPVTDSAGNQRMMYGMNFTVEELDFGGKLRYAWAQSLDSVRMVRLSLQMLISGQAGIEDMSGPVGIVQMMSETAEASETRQDALLNLLYFGAFIAINLAVMNLLPIPALDGGRVVGLLLTMAVEAVTGRKPDPKYEGWIHGAFMILLLALMAVIMFKDIIFLFRR